MVQDGGGAVEQGLPPFITGEATLDKIADWLVVTLGRGERARSAHAGLLGRRLPGRWLAYREDLSHRRGGVRVGGHMPRAGNGPMMPLRWLLRSCCGGGCGCGMGGRAGWPSG